jgi:hypothetical protein
MLALVGGAITPGAEHRQIRLRYAGIGKQYGRSLQPAAKVAGMQRIVVQGNTGDLE